jgi:hypothetical protein
VNEVFRPRSNYIWASISFTLLSLFAANSLMVNASAGQTVLEILIFIILGGFTYLLWIRPKLILRDEFIEVINPLRKEIIPYSEVVELDTKWALTIIHKRGKTRVWVAPASGKRKWIADNTFRWYGSNVPLSDARNAGSENMSASLDSLSGQAAYMIRERMKREH